MTKQVNDSFRQGDIFFEKVQEIPTEAVIKSDGIIAEGEITGHKHRISNITKAALMIHNNIGYIKAPKTGCQIVHDEHHTINLPCGNWKVVRQQQYTPQGWQQVED